MLGGFTGGCVRHPITGAKWAHGMCFDLQKILDQYLWWFGKYCNMTFAQNCHFLVIFMFFRLFLLISADFKEFLTFLQLLTRFCNQMESYYLLLLDEVWSKNLKNFGQQVLTNCWPSMTTRINKPRPKIDKNAIVD